MLEGIITKINKTVDDYCIIDIRIKNPAAVICPDAIDAESEEHFKSMEEDYVRDKVLVERYQKELTALHLGQIKLFQEPYQGSE